jgi:hypothetical protein
VLTESLPDASLTVMRCAQVMIPLMHFLSLNIKGQGPEHAVEGGGANTQPSRCTLPMFHPDMDAAKAPPAGFGYVSNDGHHFACKNPIVMQQAFHV